MHHVKALLLASLYCLMPIASPGQTQEEVLRDMDDKLDRAAKARGGLPEKDPSQALSPTAPPQMIDADTACVPRLPTRSEVADARALAPQTGAGDTPSEIANVITTLPQTEECLTIERPATASAPE